MRRRTIGKYKLRARTVKLSSRTDKLSERDWGTSDEDQLQGWRECAACWNHYKKLHEHDEEIPKEENVGIEIRSGNFGRRE